MKKILFKDFLTNKKTYNLCILYWKKLLKDIPYPNIIHTTFFYVCGNEMCDGNPILVMVVPSLNKSLRIIQDLEEDDMSWWVKDNELVISITLTNESKNVAVKLIYDYFK